MKRTVQEAQAIVDLYQEENPNIFDMTVGEQGKIYISRYYESKLRSEIEIPDFVYGFSSLEISIEEYLNITTEDYITNYAENHDRFVDCAFYKTNLRKIVLGKETQSLSNMFQKCNLYSLDIAELDVSQIESMDNMFLDCDFTNIQLTTWNVSNVTTMENMFGNSRTESTLNLSTWDVSSVTNLTDTFRGFEGNLNVSNWNVENVTNMSGTFWNYKGDVDLTLWNLKKDIYMENTFLNSTVKRLPKQ